MSLRLFHDPGFEAPIGEHIMPIRKFRLVADALRGDAAFEIAAPEPVEIADLARVHTSDYIEAVRTGEPRALAESQKFPWSPALFPSVRLTNGGVYAASATALERGVSAALASGFHHACADHGEGFCTFNGLVVALEKLRAQGRIRRAAVLDMDLHYGNGTATLAESRNWLFALSIYGNDYWENRPYRDVGIVRHPSEPNHAEAVLPNGCRGDEMLAILERNLPRLLESQPDVLLYQAGADPLRDDPYSPLDLGHADLAARDRRVFEFAKSHGLPIAWVLAGGYTPDVSQVVAVHVNTARTCAEVFNDSASRAR
jgi:acetoin utilization deacetylase AcuC-like enzyme